jgi:hypothetical protein
LWLSHTCLTVLVTHIIAAIFMILAFTSIIRRFRVYLQSHVFAAPVEDSAV